MDEVTRQTHDVTEGRSQPQPRFLTVTPGCARAGLCLAASDGLANMFLTAFAPLPLLRAAPQKLYFAIWAVRGAGA